jgi:hypothetical protein
MKRRVVASGRLHKTIGSATERESDILSTLTGYNSARQRGKRRRAPLLNGACRDAGIPEWHGREVLL